MTYYDAPNQDAVRTRDPLEREPEPAPEPEPEPVEPDPDDEP